MQSAPALSSPRYAPLLLNRTAAAASISLTLSPKAKRRLARLRLPASQARCTAWASAFLPRPSLPPSSAGRAALRPSLTAAYRGSRETCSRRADLRIRFSTLVLHWYSSRISHALLSSSGPTKKSESSATSDEPSKRTPLTSPSTILRPPGIATDVGYILVSTFLGSAE